MTPGQALLIFLAIPVGFAALVALVVFAAGWTRGARASSAAHTSSGTGPVLIVSASAVPDPGSIANQVSAGAATLAGGGARGQW